MRRFASIVVVVVLATFATGTQTIAGEPAPAASAGGEARLTMSADKLELDVEGRTAQLEGHVKLTRGAMSVRCERVDVRYDGAAHVTWVKGVGGVVADVKGVRAEAGEVEIDLAKRTLELRGGARLARGDGWLSAERARIDLATSRVTMNDVKGSIPVTLDPLSP